jgi:DNA-binding XRE family transcriptional regulator
MKKVMKDIVNVQFVGEEMEITALLRDYANVVKTKWTDFKDIDKEKLKNHLIIMELSKQSLYEEWNRDDLLDLWTHASPFLFIPNVTYVKNELAMHLLAFLDSLGAQIFKGSAGKKDLIRNIKKAINRHPSEVITRLKMTDEGLVIDFADGATAIVPFSDIKKLAESDDILWDRISIEGDRSYIHVGIKKNEYAPIPYDVLREYIQSDKGKQKKRYMKERVLTARNLGKRLKSLREETGLTQEQLAKKMKKSRWTLIRIENGEYLPKVADLQKLARGLGKTLDEVLG